MRDFKDFENLDARSLYTNVQYNIYLQNLKHLIKFCRSFRRDPLHAPSGDREYTALDGPSAAGLHDAAERRGADGALVLELRDLPAPRVRGGALQSIRSCPESAGDQLTASISFQQIQLPAESMRSDIGGVGVSPRTYLSGS